MDRLSALTGALGARGCRVVGTVLLALAAACGDDGAGTGAPPSRVVAVNGEPEADPAEGFCESTPTGDAAPALALPELASPEVVPASTGRRWVNVWATWCAPCVEELPRLVAWRDRLRADGTEVELVLLSADADADAVARFRAEHPGVPPSLRVAEPSAIAAWAATVGLDEGATLPIHLFADARSRVRCGRTGGVRDSDYEAVRALLGRM